MKKRNLTIKISELPERTEKISPDKISKIYGGCKKHYEVCKKKSDCCTHSCSPLIVVPLCA